VVRIGKAIGDGPAISTAAVKWASVRGGADSSLSARGLEARAPRVRNDNRYGGLSGGGYFAVCTLAPADFDRPQRKALICALARRPPAGWKGSVLIRTRAGLAALNQNRLAILGNSLRTAIFIAKDHVRVID